MSTTQTHQTNQEPVGVMIDDPNEVTMSFAAIVPLMFKKLDVGIKLYAHPAPSWQGLKMKEVWEIVGKLESDDDDAYSEGLNIEDLYRAIEQALKEKNTCR